EGFYHYRQYSATDLARRRSFEDVWHLLLHGTLPDAAQARTFGAEVAAARTLPDGVLPLLERLVDAGHVDPLDLLRTAVSATAGALGLRPVLDLARAQLEA